MLLVACVSVKATQHWGAGGLAVYQVLIVAFSADHYTLQQ